VRVWAPAAPSPAGPLRPVEVLRLAAAARVLLPVLSELVVFTAFLGVRQHLVGLVDLFELFFGRLIPGVHIRVVLARQFPIRFFDLIRFGVLADAQCLVVILVFHKFDNPCIL
jgi:hypothetical protein